MKRLSCTHELPFLLVGSRFNRVVATLCVALLLGAFAAVHGQDVAKSTDPPGAAEIVEMHSTPSATTKPAFAMVGKVKEVLVKPGDVVKAGQLLAVLDTDLEQADFAARKLEAESTSEIELATADHDSKKLIFERKQRAFADNSVPAEELEQARIGELSAKIQIKAYTEKRDKRLADLATESVKLEKMKLLSPMDGIIEEIKVHPGEVADPSKPDGAMTIVQTQPLWLDIPVRSGLAAKLKVGQTLEASYKNEPDEWFSGTIIFFDPVVDARSDEQIVRLELKNADAKPAGWMVRVRLPWVAGGLTDANSH